MGIGDRQTEQDARYRLDDGQRWINFADYKARNFTPYNDKKAVGRQTQFQYKSNFPLSSQRDDQTTSNNATITQQNGAEYRLRATSDTDSEAILETKQKGDYEPGTLLRCGIGVRAPSQPSGVAEWGYFNGTDGVYFRYNDSELRAVLDSGGTEKINKKQSEWNIDTLDGSGDKNNPSGITLSPADGHVYQTEIFYYGYGYAEWAIEGFDTRSKQSRVIPVHREKLRKEVLLQQPNLPLRTRIDSQSSGTQQDIFVGGRQVETIGERKRLNRVVSEIRSVTDVTTSWRPTVSVRTKDNFEDIFTEIGELDVIADVDMEVGIFRNPTLNNTSFGDPSEHESGEVATQFDTSSNTTFTASNMVWRGLVSGGNKSSVVSADLPDKPIVDGDTWAVAVQSFSGSSNTARVVLRISENW